MAIEQNIIAFLKPKQLNRTYRFEMCDVCARVGVLLPDLISAVQRSRSQVLPIPLQVLQQPMTKREVTIACTHEAVT